MVLGPNDAIGVFVDAQDRLWVADTANHRLLVIGADGKLVERIKRFETVTGRAFLSEMNIV